MAGQSLGTQPKNYPVTTLVRRYFIPSRILEYFHAEEVGDALKPA